MTVSVGIDSIAMYMPRYVLNLSDLAHARGVDPHQFHHHLGQIAMSVTPPGEDIITMAANAAHQLLSNYSEEEKKQIRTILFATESGIDHSKAAGLYLLDLLNLPKHCRIVELKQACYAGTAGLQLLLPYLHLHPNEKILWIASDIARYGLNTSGESSQGAGAVAMLLSAHPKLMVIEPESGIASENAMDFWRPTYLSEAIVEGKYSSKLYLSMLSHCFNEYHAQSGRRFEDHDFFCYHVPVPRLVETAHQFLMKRAGLIAQEQFTHRVLPSLEYGRQIGNSYTAALYIALASLLDHPNLSHAGKRVGFYSYGSGCVAEYFSGLIQPTFAEGIHTEYHQRLFEERKPINYEEYKAMYLFEYPEDGLRFDVPQFETGKFRLTRLQEHKRIYDRVG